MLRPGMAAQCVGSLASVLRLQSMHGGSALPWFGQAVDAHIDPVARQTRG